MLVLLLSENNMNIMKLSKKILILSILTNAFLSNNVHAIDLKEALVSTYATNEDLKSRRIEFIDSLEQFSQALAGFLPDISARLELDEVKNSRIGKNQNITPTKFKSIQRNLTVRQNLFNGGSSMANLKAAQEGYKAAKSRFYDEEQKILYAAIAAYLNYDEAKSIYDISDASVNFYAKSLESVDAKFKIGEATKTDLAISESQLSKAKFERSQNYSDLESNRAKFKQIIGADPEVIEKISLPNLPENIDGFSTKATLSNWALNSAKHALNAARAGVNAAAGNLLPTLTAQISAGRVYYDPEGSGNNNGLNYTTALILNIPIFSNGGAEYSRVRHARNESRKAALSIDQAIKTLQTNVVYLWQAFQSLQSGVNSAQLAVQAQETALKGVTYEFNAGLKTIVDVLNVEKALTDLRINQVRINKQRLLQAYQIKSTVGELTAKSLALNVTYFNPEEEFKKIKMKIIGF
jgi:outer membrane protein